MSDVIIELCRNKSDAEARYKKIESMMPEKNWDDPIYLEGISSTRLRYIKGIEAGQVARRRGSAFTEGLLGQKTGVLLILKSV